MRSLQLSSHQICSRTALLRKNIHFPMFVADLFLSKALVSKIYKSILNFRNIPMAQIVTAVFIPIVVGLIQIQAKQHGAKSLTILYMANMILLGSWIYSWTINLVESSLPLKMSCMLFILCLGWSDAILWSNTSNSNLFVIPGKHFIDVYLIFYNLS